MMFRRCMVLLATGAATLLGFTSCGNDSTSPQDVVLNDQTAREAGGVIADHASDIIDAFTYDGSADVPIELTTSLLQKSAAFGHFAFGRPWTPRWLAADSCATLSDTTDSDEDGIPDDLIVSFDLPGCTVAVDESLTVSLSGSFRITDVGTNPGFEITYSSVHLRFDHLSGDYIDLQLTGTQGVEATTTTASLAENLTATLDLRENGVRHRGRVSENWTANFTADSGGTFDPSLPLPSGQIDIAGSTTWVADGRSLAFALSTPVSLAYVQGCEHPPFETGVLEALVTGNQAGQFIRIRFTGCGQDPEITLTGPAMP